MRIILLLITFFITSCSLTTRMKIALSEHVAVPGYLYDSPVSTSSKSDSVFIKVSRSNINDELQVKKNRDLILPFLIYNYRRTFLEVALGESVMQGTYKEFLKESLMTESSRSGNFTGTQDSIQSGYTLEISIDSCHTKCLYRRAHHFTCVEIVIGFYLSFSYTQENANASFTTLMATAKLFKNGILVNEKKYKIQRNQALYKSDIYRNSLIHNNLDRERFVATHNLVEGLSLATKQCLENIVSDVNAYLQGKQ